MTIACDIVEEPVSVLLQYSRVPIRFDVHSVLEIGVLDSGLGGIQFTERKLETPYEKDHDAIKGEGPPRWAKRWNISNWGVISAFVRARI